MNQKELSQKTDKELLEVAKNNKPSPVIDAFLIGFLIGIIIYGAAANAWGFMFLLPLFLIYILLKKPKQYAALKKELEKRNLQEIHD
jgi:predicted benzoate:H+ symporter BenE